MGYLQSKLQSNKRVGVTPKYVKIITKYLDIYDKETQDQLNSMSMPNEQIKSNRLKEFLNMVIHNLILNTTLFQLKRKRNLYACCCKWDCKSNCYYSSIKHRRSKMVAKNTHERGTLPLGAENFYYCTNDCHKLFVKINTTDTSSKKFFCETGITGVPDTSYPCCSQQKNLIISHC